MTIEFTPWPKTPRLFRDMIVTEKIDGTNAAVIVEPVGDLAKAKAWPIDYGQTVVESDASPTGGFFVAAQSRKRVITPSDDNFGFASYVREHAADLAALLGPGTHFGEWWGSGIQRGYGLTNGDRRFSLFNVPRYAHVTETSSVPGLGVVPTLHTGPFDTATVTEVLDELRVGGSFAVDGFMRPEGVVVFHSAASQVFKALIENDAQPKGNQG